MKIILNDIHMQAVTRLIHAAPVDELTGALAVPVHQSTAFVQTVPGYPQLHAAGAFNNPTREMLEKMINEMEMGHSTFAFASGAVAIDTIIKLLQPGDEILATAAMQCGSFVAFEQLWKKFGISVKYVEMSDLGKMETAITPQTKMIWIETPDNPSLSITDIQSIAAIANEKGCLLCVDNSLATPVLQQPILLGADMVIHTDVNYLSGHPDCTAGFVIVNNSLLAEQIKFIRLAGAAMLAPQQAAVLISRLETLPLRMKEHCRNAQLIAAYLAKHTMVDKVYYPGLPEHINHEIAIGQFGGMGGGMISFTLKIDITETAKRFVTRTKLFKLSNSIGNIKSCCCHPASMIASRFTGTQRQKAGIADSLIRLSVGLEDAQDLIDDIEQALGTGKSTVFQRHQRHLKTRKQELS